MHRIALTLSVPLLVCLLATCDGGPLGPRAPGGAAQEIAKAGGAGLGGSGANGGRGPSQQPSSDDRMLVQRGELGIEVARPSEAVRAFLVKVKELGGHLAKQAATTLVGEDFPSSRRGSGGRLTL